MRNGTDSMPDKMTNFVSFLSGIFVFGTIDTIRCDDKKRLFIQ